MLRASLAEIAATEPSRKIRHRTSSERRERVGCQGCTLQRVSTRSLLGSEVLLRRCRIVGVVRRVFDCPFHHFHHFHHSNNNFHHSNNNFHHFHHNNTLEQRTGTTLSTTHLWPPICFPQHARNWTSSISENRFFLSSSSWDVYHPSPVIFFQDRIVSS